MRREVAPGAVRVGPALGKVWEFIRGQPGLRPDGHNIFLYQYPTQPGMPILCNFGVEVTRTFERASEAYATETPFGEAAVVSHRGPYDRSGYFCVPDFNQLCPPGGNGAQAEFEFIGAWNNRWLATGDIFVTGNELWSVGSYTINTQIANSPEPATFLRLGSSILILTGVVRRRLRM